MATDPQEGAKAPEQEPQKEAAPAAKGEPGSPRGAEPAKAAAAPAAAPKEKAPRRPLVLPQPLLLAGAAALALAAGVALGALLIAPRVIQARAAHAVAASEEKADKEGERSKPAVFRLDNIVVNPSGAQGARFLMATVAFELPDEKMAAAMRERESQIRDTVVATLESHSMDQLVAPGARDSIKRRLASAVAPFCPRPRKLRVYLPQFVIQ